MARLTTGAPASAIIAALGLMPHPEGGWYRETWRAPAADGERATATAILFLLEEARGPHWHTVDAAELWFWHGGAPLLLKCAESDSAPIETVRLGPDILSGETPQAVIPQGHWQAAQADGSWTLVSCVVSPGFDFEGFTLAEPGWSPNGDT